MNSIRIPTKERVNIQIFQADFFHRRINDYRYEDIDLRFLWHRFFVSAINVGFICQGIVAAHDFVVAKGYKIANKTFWCRNNTKICLIFFI